MNFWERFRNTSADAVSRPPANKSSAIAVMDASTIYGASRWWRSVHNDPTWQFGAQYRAVEDRLLFEEFLHDVLLYDRILLDNSSVNRLTDEIIDLIKFINAELGFEEISARPIAPITTMEPVVDLVCDLVSRGTQDGKTKQALLSCSIPWYYKDASHHDRPLFERSAKAWGLDLELLPSAIFLYRGLCYSGYSNHYVKEHQTPAVYLASPGRLKVLAPILSTEAMQLFEYPRRAYADLVDLLHLPESGYSFSHLPMIPFAHVSDLSRQVYERSPEEALRLVLRLRSSTEAREMRSRWADRVWNSSTSCAVGAERSNVLANSTVYGNVNMVIHAGASSV